MGEKCCPACGSTNVVAIYDRDLDCTVGWKCEVPTCRHEWRRDISEVIACVDPAAFDEFPKIDPIRGGILQ